MDVSKLIENLRWKFAPIDRYDAVLALEALSAALTAERERADKAEAALREMHEALKWAVCTLA